MQQNAVSGCGFSGLQMTLGTGHPKPSGITPSCSRDPYWGNRVDQSRICVNSWMMQMGQLLILFGQQAMGRCPNRYPDEASIRARHFSEGLFVSRL
jgi:hypothetical protein